MSLSWSALHAQLLSVSVREQMATNYTELQKESGGALPPGDISALMAFLHDPLVPPDARNAALLALIEAGQQRSALAETSTTLVLLALWPGLDAVRSRLRRVFSGCAGIWRPNSRPGSLWLSECLILHGSAASLRRCCATWSGTCAEI